MSISIRFLKFVGSFALTGLTVLTSLSCLEAQAGPHTHGSHSHGAHVHGAGKVTVAFDGKTGKMELEIPAESLLGFEHKPKTPADQKKVTEALAKLENNLDKMITFAPELKCSIKKDKLEIRYESEGSGTHADIEGEFTIECAQSPVGSKLQLRFFQPWFKAKAIETQFVFDTVQKSFKHTKNGEIVELR